MCNYNQAYRELFVFVFHFCIIYFVIRRRGWLSATFVVADARHSSFFGLRWLFCLL
jgi:hypothetical protein